LECKRQLKFGIERNRWSKWLTQVETYLDDADDANVSWTLSVTEELRLKYTTGENNDDCSFIWGFKKF